MVNFKGLFTTTILMLSSCTSFYQNKLENEQRLCITSQGEHSYYIQHIDSCEIHNFAIIMNLINCYISYNETTNYGLVVKITGESTYTFYHYNIDSWCIL